METGMDQSRLSAVPSFTILEVTIVVAILSVLVTIITLTLNRFNEQLKINREIQQELNNWMLVRSNFWTEYHLSDSIDVVSQSLVFYQPHRSVFYRPEEERLVRKERSSTVPASAPDPDEWREMNVEISSIRKETAGEDEVIILSFPLKGEEMQLRFLKQKSKAGAVNHYYEQLNE